MANSGTSTSSRSRLRGIDRGSDHVMDKVSPLSITAILSR
jgi:hypothetical protein